MNIISYVRVSTEEQAKKGMSLQEQVSACDEYARTHGYNLMKRFDDPGISGATLDRPGLQDALAYCERHKKTVDAIVVLSLNRIARDSDAFGMIRYSLKKINVKILSVTEPVPDDYAGRAFESIIATFSELDNAMRRDRSLRGTKRRIEEGSWPFRAPVGYTSIRDYNNRPTLKAR